MDEAIARLYQVVLDRRTNPQEGSYTCYLFEQGTDKILKKCGEECSEVLIAAKNGVNSDTANEISDLIYHLVVLMAQQGITPEEVGAILSERGNKIGNLKQFHQTDRNS